MNFEKYYNRFLLTVFTLTICITMGLPIVSFSQSDTKNKEDIKETKEAEKPKEPKKDEAKGPVKEPDEKDPIQEGPLELTPERYFQLLLERQKLLISSYKQMHKILDAHNGNPLAAMKDLKNHEKEREIKIDNLFKKYHVDPKDYYASKRGAEEQKERSNYLDQHPEVRDQIAEYSKEFTELEKQFQAKMRPLWRPKTGGP